VASGSETGLGVLDGRGRAVGEREHLIGWRDVVGRVGEQVQLTLDPAEVDRRAGRRRTQRSAPAAEVSRLAADEVDTAEHRAVMADMDAVAAEWPE
jgi:hypothetical protein